MTTVLKGSNSSCPHGPQQSHCQHKQEISQQVTAQVCPEHRELQPWSLEKIMLSFKIRKLLTFETVCSKQAAMCSHTAEESIMKATAQRCPAWEASCPAKSLQHWLHRAWSRHFRKTGFCIVRHLLGLLILIKKFVFYLFFVKLPSKCKLKYIHLQNKTQRRAASKSFQGLPPLPSSPLQAQDKQKKTCMQVVKAFCWLTQLQRRGHNRVVRLTVQFDSRL